MGFTHNSCPHPRTGEVPGARAAGGDYVARLTALTATTAAKGAPGTFPVRGWGTNTIAKNQQNLLFVYFDRALYGVCLRPYHFESTSSRPITDVKQHRAALVLGWVTAWEYAVS